MKTATKAFGSSSREGHDATGFYKRRMNENVTKSTDDEQPTYSSVRNRIICRSSEDMSELPRNSVALAITSPPYNCGKEYDNDLTFDEYMSLLKTVFKDVHRVLEPGGRVCVNVAGLGRKPYKPLHSHVTDLLSELGFLMRGEIIWVKGKGANGSCAWGSFGSAKNPTLRDLHEHILVFSKGRFDRMRSGKSTISKKDFMRDTLSVWEVRPESAKKVGHPAPFPKELPSRLINLYSFEGDLVLDPFMGSGTTCLAAKELKRDYIGYDINQEYCLVAENRLRRL